MARLYWELIKKGIKQMNRLFIRVFSDDLLELGKKYKDDLLLAGSIDDVVKGLDFIACLLEEKDEHVIEDGENSGE